MLLVDIGVIIGIFWCALLHSHVPFSDNIAVLKSVVYSGCLSTFQARLQTVLGLKYERSTAIHGYGTCLFPTRLAQKKKKKLEMFRYLGLPLLHIGRQYCMQKNGLLQQCFKVSQECTYLPMLHNDAYVQHCPVVSRDRFRRG